MPLEIIQPVAADGRKRDAATTETRLERPVTGIDDLKFAASRMLDKLLPSEAHKIAKDLLKQGIDGKEAPASHRRIIRDCPWDLEGLNGNLTAGMFGIRVEEAVNQNRDMLRHEKSNGHWYLEKAQLLDPSLTAWDERVAVPMKQRQVHEDGYKAIESRINFAGSGNSDEPVTEDTHRTVSHPQFTLRLTFVDATPNQNVPYIVGAPATGSAPQSVTLSEGTLADVAKAAATGAVAAMQAVDEAKAAPATAKK